MDKDMEKNISARNVLSVELVAAYVRVSTQEQKLHGLSLDAQKMKLTEYAEKHNMRIVEWYVDEGVSARKLIRKRPELQRMIQDAEQRKFERIIFIKLDRFFRSVAEYHECMKRISPVVWTTTEEKYDLSTAQGRMLVNMKLTIAEMEADMAGERVDLVNEYKVSTGQPLSGSMPFGFKIVIDPNSGRKKIVKNPEEEDILEDLIQHYMTHQTKKGTVVYAHSAHHVSISHDSLTRLLSNTMLKGEYRDNPKYCEAYLTPEEFDRLQEILKRNVKENTAENRAYIFSGLIRCPECGCILKGTTNVQWSRNKSIKYVYKRYRCGKSKKDAACGFKKTISENAFERMMLANIEKYMNEAKIRTANVEDSNKTKVPKHDIEEIHDRIDRLNYSWQTGKIRKVEQYEKDYAELLELLEQAEAEQSKVEIKDFSKIEAILHSGWEGIYNNLDDAYKRAFWRSFIQSIEIYWTTKKKEITRVNFY
ncbi:MAG: recombinase family protein [Bacteroidaceae bacterium]|nr:recombinase family protein [Bacteroidaceae bacterium]